ncbi:Maltodextrin phosphorylase [Thermococcus litoralis DSM 5473] [Rhizoctonia solani]|uniref:Maltodextrin phosphorylase [Thermococcus litoralis DSM 5473] n=1 Tax=Rhizoctonia solani TaxID=456999 RepID=A0A0K6FNQ4_9AGAM|nr:Maltodextrin phosphorylase [Thermococcus litoralis DSM 5473] [Rhizoctonia solani]
MGNSKSLNSRESLCNNVIAQPGFRPQDVIGYNFRALDQKLAESEHNWNTLCPPSEGWKNVPLRLEIPPLRQTQAQIRANKDATISRHYITVDGLRARKLLDIVNRAFSENNIATFHYVPFKSFWKPPDSGSGPAQQLFDEIYSSPSMLNAHREVQRLKIADSSCTRPRCVAYFMFGSDGTLLGKGFSNVKGHPIYGFFGNESKYQRCKPSSNTCFHIAHIPSLPDHVREIIMKYHNGKPPPESLITHLRRELMHEVWAYLLDDDFLYAWNHGIVVKCADGIERRVFPRIKIHSIDYPEKVTLATIRNLGACLCPRCLAKKESASKLGTSHDTHIRVSKRRIESTKRIRKIEEARHLIYDLGHSVQSKQVEALLQAESYVPTMNAFSRRLSPRIFKFNIFETFVVDQLHEIELGVWKSLFQHLLRLLHLGGSRNVAEFNERFRSVPTFGSVIRMFSDDVASMGRLAARDFEDILQCCIPVFEGLLPPQCDAQAQRLLFIFAEWHGLAKLRRHTTETLKTMKKLTAKLGAELRSFAELTKTMNVRETPDEYARRKKRQAAAQAQRSMETTASKGKTKTSARPEIPDGRRICYFNINTYKVHAIGDYIYIIAEFGTTDSYSTQICELQHRFIKIQFERTNKKDVVEQMTRIGDVASVLKRMDLELEEREAQLQSQNSDCEFLPLDHEGAQSLLNGLPYTIGQTERSEDSITSITRWAHEQRRDDAMKFFIPQLKRFFLARFLGSRDHPKFNEQEITEVRLHRDRMYRHKTLRINYTSYDVLRHQDLLNPSTSNRFIMLPAQSEDGSIPPHPFIYAKVLGVYHAQVSYGKTVPRREDFVHVRWLYYDTDTARRGGWDECRLDRISYEQCCTDQDLLDSFDFIHPSDIIRAVHLIPDFQSGRSDNLLTFPNSIAHDNDEHWDWSHYYVNRFVDRDILMRYLGGGVGHYRYTIHGSENNLDSEQSESDNIEVPLEMRQDENKDVESEDERDEVESEDETSVGNESICLAEDEVSDEEDEGVSEFGDDCSEDGMEDDVADEDEDALYGF